MAFLLNIKKVLRYIQLYGIPRTLIKVRGRYHMKKKYRTLPPIIENKEIENKAQSNKNVGIIGCGFHSYTVIAYYLKNEFGPIIRGCMDIDIHKAASLSSSYQTDYYTDDAEKILDDERIELIYICSNHSTHAEYAIKALNRGKDVYIEKPHVVSFDQLNRLIEAQAKSKGRILSIGYNRPHSQIGSQIKEALFKESGNTMINWFVAGHSLGAEHWYHNAEEGGRVLGNLCHWTDLTYQMMEPVARYPITINPTRSVKSDCDISVSYTFGDSSIGVLSFSAKGAMFEGVKERLVAHRGDTLLFMEDFKRINVEVADRKYSKAGWHRDHGHGLSVITAYRKHLDPDEKGLEPSYVWQSAELFLKTKEALETNTILTINGEMTNNQLKSNQSSKNYETVTPKFGQGRY